MIFLQHRVITVVVANAPAEEDALSAVGKFPAKTVAQLAHTRPPPTPTHSGPPVRRSLWLRHWRRSGPALFPVIVRRRRLSSGLLAVVGPPRDGHHSSGG